MKYLGLPEKDGKLVSTVSKIRVANANRKCKLKTKAVTVAGIRREYRPVEKSFNIKEPRKIC